MKKLLFGALGALLIAMMFATMPGAITVAQESGSQVLLNLSWLNTGVSARGARVLQTGEVSTLTAAVASATRTAVATGSAGTQIYLRGILVEKAAATTGTVTVSTGTGTNCGTSTDVILGPITSPPAGYIPIGILLTSAEDACITTEGANTGARLLVN